MVDFVACFASARRPLVPVQQACPTRVFNCRQSLPLTKIVVKYNNGIKFDIMICLPVRLYVDISNDEKVL